MNGGALGTSVGVICVRVRRGAVTPTPPTVPLVTKQEGRLSLHDYLVKKR